MKKKHLFSHGLSGWWRVFAAMLVFAALAGCSKGVAVSTEPVVGRPFPPLLLGKTAGDALAAPALRGKMLLLNVWATWCPPCRREMPGLERLSKSLDAQRFAVVGMATDQDENLASEFLLQNGITFINFFDQNGQLARRWGMQVYPETFLIAPDGTLLRRFTGFREWDSPETMAELEAAYKHGK